MNFFESYILQKGKNSNKKRPRKIAAEHKSKAQFWIPTNDENSSSSKIDAGANILRREPEASNCDEEKREKVTPVPEDNGGSISFPSNIGGQRLLSTADQKEDSPMLGSLVLNAYRQCVPSIKPANITPLDLGNDNYYIGEFDGLGNICGIGEIHNDTGDCVIRGKYEANRLLELELYRYDSFTDINVTIVRKNQRYLLTYFDTSSFSSFVEIMPLQFIQLTTPFPEIHQALMKRLTIDDIVEDEITANRKKQYLKFKSALQECTKESATKREQAENLHQIHIALKIHNEFALNFELFTYFENDHCTTEVQRAAAEMIIAERAFIRKNFTFSINLNFDFIDFRTDLNSLYVIAVERHRDELLSICRFSLPLLKQCLSDRLLKHQIVWVNKLDLEALSRVEALAEGNLPLSFCEQHQQTYINKIQHGPVEPISAVYSHLIKCLIDTLHEIMYLTRVRTSDLLVQKDNQWCLPSNLWQPTTFEEKALAKQVKVVLRLIEYHRPGGSKNTELRFECKKFGDIGCQGWLWPVGRFTSKSGRIDFDVNSNDPTLRLWIYIFDSGVERIFRRESGDSFRAFANYCDTIATIYFKLAEKVIQEVDLFRIITQKFVHFISLAYANFLGSKSRDIKTIVRQISIISNLESSEDKVSRVFRKIARFVNDCIIFWRNKTSIRTDFSAYSSSLHHQEMKEISDEILRIVDVSLDDNIDSDEVPRFFAAFNSFIEDFKNVDFRWFIKCADLPEFESPSWNSSVGLVQSELSSLDRTLEVVDTERFIKLAELGTDSIPEHYTVNIVKKLLEIANAAGRKKFWNGNVPITKSDNLSAVVSCLEAIGPSLLCLGEIIKFRDFEHFKQEYVNTFRIPLENSVSLMDFRARMNHVKNSFLYYTIVGVDCDEAMRCEEHLIPFVEELCGTFNSNR